MKLIRSEPPRPPVTGIEGHQLYSETTLLSTIGGTIQVRSHLGDCVALCPATPSALRELSQALADWATDMEVVR